MSFMEMMAEAMAGHEDDDGPGILPEAAIERMKEAASRLHAPIPFNIGDIVTPRKDAPVRGAGQPYMVIAVDENAPIYRGDPGTWEYATKWNVLILTITRDHVVPYAVAHWMLEPYSQS